MLCDMLQLNRILVSAALCDLSDFAIAMVYTHHCLYQK